MTKDLWSAVCSINCMDVAGYVGAATSMIGFVPQIYKVYKTKSAGDLSALMILNFLVCSIAWVIYGFLKDAMPVVAANTVSALIDCVLLGQKFYFHPKK